MPLPVFPVPLPLLTSVSPALRRPARYGRPAPALPPARLRTAARRIGPRAHLPSEPRARLAAMAPTGQAHLDIALAIVCSLGGLMGYVKKRSAASLVAGLSFGAAYGASAHLIQNVDAYKGHMLGTAASGLLAAAMAPRFLKTKKVMPAGLMAGVGLLGLFYHGKRMADWAP